MKSLMTLIGLFVAVSTTFAQVAKVEGSAAAFEKQVAKGQMEIILPQSADAESVEKSASYYTDYFEVSFNEESKVATINMIDNTASNRRVISRFLLTNGVRNIELDGTNYSINEFYDQFLSE